MNRPAHFLLLVFLAIPSASYGGSFNFEKWKSSGTRIPYKEYEISVHVETERSPVGAPWCTFLHGFPTSSMDWSQVIDRLSSRCKVLTLDFVGFGDSDKPEDYSYSGFDRADQVIAIWKHFGITESLLISHDFADDVTMELLVRQKEAGLPTVIKRVVMLNGGIFPALHKNNLAQKILLTPGLGKEFSHHVADEPLFSKSFSPIFSPDHPISKDDIKEEWASISNRDGQKIQYETVHYITDREQNVNRWPPVLASPGQGVTLKLVWGLKDPIAGRKTFEEIKRRAPHLLVVGLENVGHYPHLEVPERISAELSEFLFDQSSGEPVL